MVQVRLVVSAVVTTCAHADEKASTLFHMDQSGLLLHVTGPVRAKMQGGWWYGGKVCLVLTQTYRYTLDMHPSLRFHDCRL